MTASAQKPDIKGNDYTDAMCRSATSHAIAIQLKTDVAQLFTKNICDEAPSTSLVQHNKRSSDNDFSRTSSNPVVSHLDRITDINDRRGQAANQALQLGTT